jgi:large subunit ribosomal protein L21
LTRAAGFFARFRRPANGLGDTRDLENGIMYAVIRTGGKQYKVAKNDVVVVEKLAAEKGKTVELGDVLMVVDGATAKVGSPTLAGAKVTATVLEQAKGEKVIVFKKRRRKNSRRKNGHRQFETTLRIVDIKVA